MGVSLTNQEVECTFMSETIFEVVAKFGKKIRLTKGKYDHVCKRHPEVTGEISKMRKTLASPQTVRKSLYDEKVWLFYRFFKSTPVTEKYLMVAARILNDEGFVVTSYFAGKVMMGEEIWRER